MIEAYSVTFTGKGVMEVELQRLLLEADTKQVLVLIFEVSLLLAYFGQWLRVTCGNESSERCYFFDRTHFDTPDVYFPAGIVYQCVHANGWKIRVIGKEEVGHFSGMTLGETWKKFLLIEPFPFGNFVGILVGSVLPAYVFQRRYPTAQTAEQLPVGFLNPAVYKVVFLYVHRLKTAPDMRGEFQPQPMCCQQNRDDEREKQVTAFHDKTLVFSIKLEHSLLRFVQILPERRDLGGIYFRMSLQAAVEMW